MRYDFIGHAPVKLSDGRTLLPGHGPFEARLADSEERFLLKIGAIKMSGNHTAAPLPEPEPSAPEADDTKDAGLIRRWRK